MFRFLKRTQSEGQSADDASRQALARILELNKEMARAPRPELLPDRILDAAIELAGAERGFLIQRAPSGAARAAAEAEPEESEAVEVGQGWAVVAARNVDREHVKKAQRKVSRSVTAKVLESGAPLRSDDAVNDDALSPRQSVNELRLRSVLCVPLRVGDEVRGCLYVDNRFAQGKFDDTTTELLESFADQAALALERVRLLEENARMLHSLEIANAELKAALAEQSKALDSLSEGFVPSGLELRFTYPQLIGRGRAMTAMLMVLDRVTDGDFPVLLYGESGTGKELIARALHLNGPRRAAPFVGVNCGAIAEGLLESELFGAVKGAYTGAVKDRQGLVEAAGGGVLFLDEIGEMSLSLQAKLLRVLQERKFRRVGGNEELAVDVRVISATHRDLAREVAAGRFREDLYYRLKVVQVEAPPLRERREDIPVLVEHFLAKLHDENRSAGRARPTVSRECLERLMAHDWPGNVRELQNELTRMYALGGDTLGPDLIAHLSKTPRSTPQVGMRSLVGRKMEDVEAELIRATLEATGGKRGEAARLLGIPRRTFYNRLKALGIDP
ncbi:MAG: sigma-54-dependent Fis family transcriptional regulator [Planctomycetes bacterium]|nr:sigma-54-dependent Fis family transcriptional regulator [Planctomycetota bacterium]